MSGFAAFVPNPPSSYPQPSTHYISAPGEKLPTNSWSQNAVKGTVWDGEQSIVPYPVRSRDTKPLPWFVSPYYGELAAEPDPYITLGHATVGIVTHATNDGENSVSIDARGFIDRLTRAGPAPSTLDLVKLDDGSATYNLSGTMIHTSRGSPFIVAKTTAAEALYLRFSASLTLAGPSGIVAEQRGNYRYIEVPFTREQLSVSTTTNYDNIRTFTIPVWSRYTQTGTVSIVGLQYLPGNVPQAGSLSLNGSEIGRFVPVTESNPTGFLSQAGASYNVTTKTVTFGNISILLGAAPLFTVINLEQVAGAIRFLSQNSFTANISGGELVLAMSPASSLWMYVNDSRTYYTDPNLGYVTSMVAIQGSGGTYSLNYTSGAGSSLYSYTPSWWQSDYSVSGLTYLADTVYDVTYRTCTLALTNAASNVFTPTTAFALPTSPEQASVLNLQAFKQQIGYDIEVYYKRLAIEAYKLQTAYVFFQNMATYGRILSFAKVNNILEPAMYTEFVSLITAWLNGTNGQVPASAPGSNKLVRETLWGGIITLADYNTTLGIAGEGSFGNSYYNDHHFQYGYFFSALYTLYTIGQVQLLNNYEPWIRQLLQDVVTAAGDATSIAIKTRHKDWYFGHSWATGLTIATDIDQESVSEAINCYYQAWLLSTAMFTITSAPRYQSMQAISQAALFSEIATYRAFWTRNGEQINAPSTTIVHAFSKTFAAFAPGQPTSYPSTSLYRYSIITLPYTDITPLFIDKDWIRRFSDALTPYWQRVNRDLIAGLCNYEKDIPRSWSYEPTPSPYDNNMDRSPEGITSWGFFGLQLLALGAQITDDEATRYYNKVVFKGMDFRDANPNLYPDEDIIKRFCSFSNGFNVLYEQADYNELPPTTGPEDNPVVEATSVSLLASRPCPPRRTEVPTIEIYAEPTPDGLDVQFVRFEVTDVIDWSRSSSRCAAFDQCIPTGLVPDDDVYVTTFTLTRPDCNFNSMLNAPGTSLLQKCRNLNAIAPYIIQYTYVRWILARLMYGSFNLRYLARSFTNKFMRDLARSRFNLFYSEYFNSLSLIDYNGKKYDVVGYGNVPQNGKYYYVG
ncbi:Glycosyl hydrolase family 81 [uncultured virus]|nr:Glycosyl hydrolase family 81 [uncultured virus]